MIYNNKLYLNLEDQVAYNNERIDDLTSVQGLLGIKIVGQITDITELPAEDGETFEALEYGDAYILDRGESAEEGEAQYVFYVKTRANAQTDYDHWFALDFNSTIGPKGADAGFGSIDATISGSVGTPGVTVTSDGPNIAKNIHFNFSNLRGDPGNRIYHAAVVPSASGYNVGDLFIATGSMALYQVGLQGSTKLWQPVGILKGSDGSQGLQGPKGDPGGFIHIVGLVSSVGSLPDPVELQDPTAAYFVGTDATPANNPLYIQIGETLAETVWTGIGLINLATYVTVGGQYQGEWNADTKLDKRTGEGIEVYAHSSSSQIGIPVASGKDGNTVPIRTNGGQLRCGLAQGDDDCINKAYLSNWLNMVVQ